WPKSAATTTRSARSKPSRPSSATPAPGPCSRSSRRTSRGARNSCRPRSDGMILLIDNYDSFTYNLVQALGALGADVETVRNDALTPEEVEARAPERIVISPGPCTPRESGVSNRVIRRLAGRIPILGVCLGHQCIAHAFGAQVVRARRPMHGKTSEIRHDGAGVFAGLPNPF